MLDRVPEHAILTVVLKAAGAMCTPYKTTPAYRRNCSFTPYLEALESTSKHTTLTAIDRACADVARDLVALLYVGGNSSDIEAQFFRMREKADEEASRMQFWRNRVRCNRVENCYHTSLSNAKLVAKSTINVKHK